MSVCVCMCVYDIKLKVELFPYQLLFIPSYLSTIHALFIVLLGIFIFEYSSLYK